MRIIKHWWNIILNWAMQFQQQQEPSCHRPITDTVTKLFKSLDSVRFLMFSKEVSSAHWGCICLIKNTVKIAILWNNCTIENNCCLCKHIVKYNLFLRSKLNFQHDYSSLQCHMILQKSYMLICCSRNISDYHQFWKLLCCLIFLWKSSQFFFMSGLLCLLWHYKCLYSPFWLI